MFWEYYQQRTIQGAESRASRADTKATNVKYDLGRMEDKLDSLALTCQAMWEILRERDGITDEVLIAKMTEIDLRDGRADGRMSSAGVPCKNCGRELSRHRERCLYCGTAVDKPHVFQQ